MKALQPNTLLQERYLIVNLIGKGGMGEVYLAIDQRLGSHIALKRTFFTDDEALAHAFEREARTLANLRHPVLPKVSDHFTENDEQFLVMEFISGEDMFKRLETTKKPFPMNWVLFWADELLDALAYLHTQNPPIIHRDIKPQNLKITSDNHIILLDFGLAKNSTGLTKVQTGSILGYTPHYAPMEQIRGTGTTARSDLYSLSATLYHLMSNTVPPDALTRADDVLGSRPDSVKPLNEVSTQVPLEISEVILKGMSLRAEERFASARQMQAALREAYAAAKDQIKPTSEATPKTEIIPVSADMPGEKTEAFAFEGSEGERTLIMDEPPQTGPDNTEITPPSFLQPTYQEPEPIGEKTEVMPLDMIREIETPAPHPADQPEIDPIGQGEKTEIMPLEMIREIETATPHSDHQPEIASFDPGEKTEIMPALDPEDDFVFEEAPASSRLAENTMPLINAQDQDQASNHPFAPIPDQPYQQTEQFQNSSPSFEDLNDHPEEEKFAAAAAAASAAPPPIRQAPKKSGGKLLALLGGLGLLGILGIGGVAGGWYYLNSSPKPTPSAAPTPASTPEAATPAPEATPEVMLGGSANSNTEVNSNSAPETGSGTKEEPKNPGVKPVQNPTPAVAQDKPKTPNPIAEATPRPPANPRPTPFIATQKTPAPKPTPKAAPSAKKTPNIGRSDGLQ